MKKGFPQALMSPLILVLTLMLWLLPFSFLIYFVFVGQIFSGAIALLLFALQAIVWLFCGLLKFKIVPGHLEIVFPAWRRNLLFSDISGIYLVSSDKFKKILDGQCESVSAA